MILFSILFATCSNLPACFIVLNHQLFKRPL